MEEIDLLAETTSMTSSSSGEVEEPEIEWKRTPSAPLGERKEERMIGVYRQGRLGRQGFGVDKEK